MGHPETNILADSVSRYSTSRQSALSILKWPNVYKQTFQQSFIRHQQKAQTSKILVEGNQTVGYKIPFPVSFGFDKNQGLQ